MPSLQVLSRHFVQKLQHSIGSNLKRYKANETWIERWAGKEKWELPTSCELVGPLTLLLPDEDGAYDLENAIRLHKSLPSLTPVQAQDPRLWTRLTHVELWPYMRARWPIERYADNIVVGRIQEQYFVAQRQSRALVRNGAARLWWASHLTFEPSRKNPYELTEVLLFSLDIAKNLLERSFGRAPKVTHTFLEYVLRHKDECLHDGNRSRLLVRYLSKALNFHGGICVLDCMGKREISEFLNGHKARFDEAQELAATSPDDQA